jgi:hypothetical protein
MSPVLAGLTILVIGDSQMMAMLPNLHNQLEGAGAVVYSYAMCGSTAQDWIVPTVTSCGSLERQDKSPAVLDLKPRPTWSINDLIAKHHPNLIVVELGDTMGGYGDHIELPWVHEQIGGLTARIAAANISCVWVGPPWGQDEGPYHKSVAQTQRMSQLLSTSVSPCRYIDSTTFSRPGEWPTRDGGHLEPDGYRKWATAITGSIIRLKGQSTSSSR